MPTLSTHLQEIAVKLALATAERAKIETIRRVVIPTPPASQEAERDDDKDDKTAS